MVEFVIKQARRAAEAVISEGGKEVARIKPGRGREFSLSSSSGRSWTLNPRVHGEIRPFSMTVTSRTGKERVLTIRKHIFSHGGTFYMLGGIPSDSHRKDHVVGRKHITRMDAFPFSRLDQLDRMAWNQLWRHRGVSVGEIDGLGVRGHKVVLPEELEDVGLPLAAASYLLYSAA